MSDESNQEMQTNSPVNTEEKAYRSKPINPKSSSGSRRHRQPILIAFQPPDENIETERPYRGSKLPPKINISAPPKNTNPPYPTPKETPANSSHSPTPLQSNWEQLCEDSTVQLVEAAISAFPGLVKELKALRADRDRLNWLEQCAQLNWAPENYASVHIELTSGEPFFQKPPSLRDVIDNASKQQS